MKKKKNLVIINHPIALKDLTILRDERTDSFAFRQALRRVAKILVTVVTHDLKLDKFQVKTPLDTTTGYKFHDEIVLVPVLRAGLGFVDSILEILPESFVGHIGIYREEKSLKPIDYYLKLPKNIKKAKIFVVDPMLATGGSACAAIHFLKEKGAKDITMLNLVAAPEGVAEMQREHPDVGIFTIALDRKLNDKGYILPGLGDAGDRIFGTL